MNDLLFAVPWWIPTLLAIIGIALFFNGNNTQVMKIRNAGLGILALAIVWALVSYFVDTDKEKVEKGTKQLLQSVVDGAGGGDWSKFSSALTPTVSFKMGGASVAVNADLVTATAKIGAESIKLKSAIAQNLVVEQQDGSHITARCDIFSTQDSYAPIETTSWQFDWVQTGEGWKVQNILMTRMRDVPDDQLDGIARAVGNKR
jgi:hypothetical protein